MIEQPKAWTEVEVSGLVAEMQAEGLIVVNADAEFPPLRYRLSEKGQDLALENNLHFGGSLPSADTKTKKAKKPQAR